MSANVIANANANANAKKKNKSIYKVVEYFAKEILDDDDIKNMVKDKIISPIMRMLYIQLQPYIILLMGCIILMILSSLLTLAFFFFSYLRK